MSSEEIKVTEITCDNPDCRKRLLVDADMPVGWYQGSVVWHHEGGGSGDSWDACSKKCIKPAVIAASDGTLERDWRDRAFS